MIGFSASSLSVFGLCLPFSLFVIGCLRVYPQQLKIVYSDYVKQRILFYRQLGMSFIQIIHCLAEEGHATMKIGVCKFIRCYEETRMISHTPGGGKASKFTADTKKIIEELIITNIDQNMPRNFMLSKASTGGPLLLNHQISSQ